MMATINISLPKKLHQDAKKMVAEEKYSSISEVVRAGIRRVLYDADKITENGFPGWFEDKVLESAAQPPSKNDIVLETDEDIDKFFRRLHSRLKKRKIYKHGQNNNSWPISTAVR